MTQEEKARAYDKAFEEAKNIHRFSSNIAEIKRMEQIFPELKESEDERIRKELIKYFSEGREYLSLIPYNKEEVLTWLEKQGKLSIYNTPSREIILAIWDLGNEWKELTKGCISTEYGTQLEYIQKHWQENEYYLRAKQGEQILANSCKTCKDEQKSQRMVSAEAKEALYDKPVVSKETIMLIIELFISWNGDTEAIDFANLPTAVEYINEYINEN